MNKPDVLWKHYSSRILALIAVVGGAWQFVPEFRDVLPGWAITALGITGLAAKLIPQSKKE